MILGFGVFGCSGFTFRRSGFFLTLFGFWTFVVFGRSGFGVFERLIPERPNPECPNPEWLSVLCTVPLRWLLRFRSKFSGLLHICKSSQLVTALVEATTLHTTYLLPNYHCACRHGVYLHCLAASFLSDVFNERHFLGLVTFCRRFTMFASCIGIVLRHSVTLRII